MKLAGCTIKLVKGDITEQNVEAVVNAANSNLILGSGVAGAIKRKGGPSIQMECQEIGSTAVGSAAITGAGDLKANFVIHAVGPKLGEGEEEHKLARAMQNCLDLCQEHAISSVAFPAISTGVFGYPVEECARVMLQSALHYLQRNNPEFPERISFCLNDSRKYHIFRDELSRYDHTL